MGAGLIQCGDDPEVTDAVGEAADGDTEPEGAAGVELGPQAAGRSAAAAVAATAIRRLTGDPARWPDTRRIGETVRARRTASGCSELMHRPTNMRSGCRGREDRPDGLLPADSGT